MSDAERLLRVLEDAKRQMEESPALTKNPEPPPGMSTRQWLENTETRHEE